MNEATSISATEKVEQMLALLPWRYRILIVDDIEDNRFTLDTMLSVLGDFDVDEAADGFEALSKMESNTYDLVYLDIMMPGMTGLEVLEKLTPNQRKNCPEIIVVSALEDMSTTAAALQHGALDYLTKPIEQQLLIARLSQLLERKVTSLQLEKQQARIEADLKKAAVIQQSICPDRQLSISGAAGSLAMNVFGQMRTSLEIGGDFFDYFTLPDGNLFFVVGDACDKGPAAAMYATRTRDMLRLATTNRFEEFSKSSSSYLERVVADVNVVLSENNEDCWFVTLWAGLLNSETGALTWCSAGHCEALHIRENGEIGTLPIEPGSPCGLDDRAVFESETIQLQRSERVFVFSDGLPENRNASDQEFGEAALSQTLHSKRSSELINCVTETMHVVEEHSKGVSLHDDLTLVAVELSN